MFLLGVLVAFIALGLGVTATYSMPAVEVGLPVPVIPLLLAWAVGVAALSFTALIEHMRTKGRFDIAVASEVVVVYGIATLVLSIALGVLRVLPIWQAGGNGVSLEQLEPVLLTFAEGLVAAGFSPLCAVSLRLVDAYQKDGGAAGTDPGAATAALVGALTKAATAAAGFTTAIEAARKGTEDAAGALPKALEGAAKKVDDAGSVIAAGAGRASGGLADVGVKAEAAAGHLGTASTEMGKLGAASKEGAALLEGLRELISQIERFIRDHGGRAPS